MVHLVVLTAPQHTVRHNDQELLKSAEVTEHSNTKGPDPENQAHSRLSGNTISRSTLNLQGCGESGALTVHIHYRCQRTLRPLWETTTLLHALDKKPRYVVHPSGFCCMSHLEALSPRSCDAAGQLPSSPNKPESCPPSHSREAPGQLTLGSLAAEHPPENSRWPHHPSLAPGSNEATNVGLLRFPEDGLATLSQP
jgi:hypothetical protein